MSVGLPFPLNFVRQYSGPIDVDFVFQTEEDMRNYLSSPRRYAGQLVTCNELEGQVFILNSNKDTWIEVGGGVFSWVYENEEERLNDHGFSLNDVGKLAWQKDDNSVWILTEYYGTCSVEWDQISGKSGWFR